MSYDEQRISDQIDGGLHQMNEMEKKQTAVQWLSNEIDFMFSFVNQETANKFNALVQQALQMEREQIEAKSVLLEALERALSDHKNKTWTEDTDDLIEIAIYKAKK